MTPAELRKALCGSSLHFGSDSLSYASENKDREASVVRATLGGIDKNGPAEGSFGAKELRATHIVLGDDKMMYDTSNKLRDATGSISKYTGKLNTKQAALLRSSSLHLGNDATPYQSTAQQQNDWDQHAVARATHSGAGSAKDEMKRLKQELRATNYELGDAATNYQSTTHSAHSHDPSKVLTSTLDAALKADLRASHFQFGNDNSDYSTAGTMSDTTGSIDKYRGVLNVAAKSMLRKSNLCLGDDGTTMMSTAQAAQWDNPGAAGAEERQRFD